MSDIVPWVAAGDLNCTPCDIDPEVLAKAATAIADNLSGHRFGLRMLRIRPRTLSPDCRCLGACRCGRMTHVILSEPIYAITEVRVDGVALTSDEWALYGDNRLVRINEPDAEHHGFPCCQNLAGNPATDRNTMEVSCTVGTPPDEAAELAVDEIACEMSKAFDNPAACRLPKRIQSMTRQQLSVNFVDPSTVLAKGFAGLPLVDLWLGSLDADSQRRGGRAVDLSQQTTWRAPVTP